MTETDEEAQQSLAALEPQIHYSANALVSALAESVNESQPALEQPIEALLGFALSNNHWLGARVFGFPNDLHYRTQPTKSFADVSGYCRDSEWFPNKQPIVQIEVMRAADLNHAMGYGIHLDWPRTSARWRVMTYGDILERLVSAGVSELESGQARTLMLTMIRQRQA